jgi:HD-GYP domain-containing protein (c-di-GMP phosphodiesterase class II)
MPATKLSKPVIGGLVALLAILLAGAWLIHVYVAKERQRDLDDWAIRLGLIAETRVSTIEDKLGEQVEALSELANNASLQLYLWQLTKREEPEPAIEPAQLSYLRNLVLASAKRYGFMPAAQQPEIPANLPKRYDAGLALVDARQRHVVSTTGMPDIGAAFRTAIQAALDNGKPQFSELVTDADERALLGIAVPVPVVLGAQDNWAYGGVVLGVISAERSLYPLLQAGVPITPSDESLLVTERDRQVVYLSPTRDGGKPTRKTLPVDRSRLAAAAALAQPGAFGEYRNYQGREVLATSRALQSVPWLLLQEVDATQALLESNRHRRFLITAFSLLLFFMAATLVAAWRHGSSVRATHDADALRAKTRELEKQTELLHAVTDNAEAYVILMDAQQQVLFANARLAAKLHVTSDELTGNSLAGVLGPANVQPMADSIDALQKDGTSHHCMRQMVIDDEQRSFQCSLVPVDRVGDRYHAMLLVMQDVTELQRAQQKNANLMRKLVEALMHVVDLHDPNSANHSARMAEVANAVGQELKLSPEDSRTLDLAASLANLGKIFVPKEVLTKTEPLTEAEQALVQRHVHFGTEMIADLDFEGPVVDTIAQKQEHLDGSGYPNGLKGDEILLTARILAVSNAFVALVSPRAYRKAISIEAALNQLLSESGSKYDRHVVAALFHVAENRADWSEWLGE